jgi:hypothetical protein
MSTDTLRAAAVAEMSGGHGGPELDPAEAEIVVALAVLFALD